MPELTKEEMIAIRKRKEELLDSLIDGEYPLFFQRYVVSAKEPYPTRQMALRHTLAQLQREVELTKREFAAIHNPQPFVSVDCPHCGAKGKDAAHLLNGGCS